MSTGAPSRRYGGAGLRGIVRGLAALALAFVLAMRAAPAAPADEAAVQAAYVINFVRYARWPDATPGRPYVIVVLGTPDAAATMRRLAARAGPVDGHPLVVRAPALTAAAPARAEASRLLRGALAGADVVFVAASHADWNAATVAATEGRPVLTVGVGAGFVRNGGMLALVDEAGRVRFTANEAAIARSPVDVSARVLLLARPARTGS